MGIRETNMDEVRRIAKTFLMIDYVKTPFSPIVVIHPFTIQVLYLSEKATVSA